MTDALWQLGGWTMLHFLWAGTIAALVGGLVRLIFRRAAPAKRYAISLTTLAILAALPVAIAAKLALDSPVILAGRADAIATLPKGPQQPTPSQDGPAIYRSAAPRVIDLAESPILVDPDEASSLPHANKSASAPAATGLPATESAPLPSMSSFVPYLPYAWLLGTPLTFALLATGLVGSERLRRRSAVLTAGPAFEACERLRQAMRIAQRVSVAACEGLAQPVLVGVVRPLILLPASALSGWTPEELEMVLVHELAHVRRWDNLVNLLQRIVESLLFFHPVVWLVSRQVRRDREECCDWVVVSRTSQPQRYAELLLSIAAVLPRGQAPRLAAASAMADHPLAGRIRRILKLEDEPMWVSRKALFLAIAIPALVALGLLSAGVNARSADAEEPAAEPEQSAAMPKSDLSTRKGMPAKLNFHAFQLKHARASLVSINLEEYFQEEVTAENPNRLRFIWDADGNSIVVKNATEVQLATIRDLIELYDRPKSAVSLESRLERLRDTIRQMMPLFEPRPDNPVKTVVYRYDKARREFVDHWHYIIGGLQDRPAGTKYTFNWNRKSDHVEISAPAAAHKQLFEPAFSGIDLLAGESEVRGLQPGQEVQIQVVGAFPEAPINGVFVIEPQGTVALGATYGRVEIAGLSLVEAEKAVAEKLKEILTDVQVQITLPPGALRRRVPANDALPTPPAFSAAEEEAYRLHGRLPQPKPAYLYDGKTFDEWRDLMKYELKIERRVDAANAISEFVRSGYDKEAATAVLDVAEQYDFDNRGPGNLDDLERAVLNTLSQIDPTSLIPMLADRVAENPDRLGRIARILIGNAKIDPSNRALLDLVRRLAGSSNHDVQGGAIQQLKRLAPEEARQQILEFLRDDSPKTIRLGLSLVDTASLEGPRATWGRTLYHEDVVASLLFHPDDSVRRAARAALDGISAEDAAEILPGLIEKLDKGDADAKLAAIRAIASLAPHAEEARPALVGVIDNGERKEQVAAAYAIGALDRALGARGTIGEGRGFRLLAQKLGLAINTSEANRLQEEVQREELQFVVDPIGD